MFDSLSRAYSFQKRAFAYVVAGIFSLANNLASIVGTPLLWGVGEVTDHPVNIPAGPWGAVLQVALIYLAAWLGISVARYVIFCFRELSGKFEKPMRVPMTLIWIGGIFSLIGVNVLVVGCIWFFVTKTATTQNLTTAASVAAPAPIVQTIPIPARVERGSEYAILLGKYFLAKTEREGFQGSYPNGMIASLSENIKSIDRSENVRNLEEARFQGLEMSQMSNNLVRAYNKLNIPFPVFAYPNDPGAFDVPVKDEPANISDSAKRAYRRAYFRLNWYKNRFEDLGRFYEEKEIEAKNSADNYLTTQILKTNR